jgi:hypothetical protein
VLGIVGVLIVAGVAPGDTGSTTGGGGSFASAPFTIGLRDGVVCEVVFTGFAAGAVYFGAGVFGGICFGLLVHPIAANNPLNASIRCMGDTPGANRRAASLQPATDSVRGWIAGLSPAVKRA